jgi:hypothetical protein
MRQAIALIMATALTAGCSWIGVAGPPPSWFTERSPLPSCGVEEMSHGEGVNTEARRCLFDAYQAGEGAEFVSNMVSVEGDPIARYYRVHPDGRIEIYHDASRDRFGSGTWERLECDALLPVEEVNTPDSYTPPEFVFVEEDCANIGEG